MKKFQRHVIARLIAPEGYTPLRFSFGKYNTLEEMNYVVENFGTSSSSRLW